MRNQVVIIGGGLMGCGIAAVASAHGETVVLVGRKPEKLAEMTTITQDLLTELCKNEIITPEQAAFGQAHVHTTTDLDQACSQANFIIEAINENLADKQALFQKLDAMLPEEVIITTTTSGLLITDISATSQHRHRMATAHFWFPAHLAPLVEVVMSPDTTRDTAQAAFDRIASWGKAPVIVTRDVPGQLGNRMLQAIIREATAMVESGLATPEDVDTAIKMGLGVRLPVWGPLEHMDAIGLELGCSVQNSVLPHISRDTQANEAFTRRLANGQLGYKSGQGFYDWSVKDMDELQSLRNDFVAQTVKFIQSRKGK